MMSLLLLKVLLIEDNPSDVLLLRSILEEDQLSNFELTQADRLSDGIKLLDGGSFDIILADLGLPDSSGLETFERLHKHAPEIPVIVFSGNDNEEQAIHAVREGAQDYLVKSLSGFEIAARSIRYGIERSKLQGTLRDSEHRFSTLFRLNPVPVGITRQTDYSIVDVNDAWIELTGYTRDEAVGHTSAELGLVKPEKLKQIRKIIQEQGEINQFEVQFYRRSGEERHILISSEPIQLGSESYILNNLLDITERKRAEEALKESEARFSTAFFTNPVSQSIIATGTGKIIEVNDACCQLYGFSREELIGANPDDLNLWIYHEEELAAVNELQKTGHLLPKEITIRSKSGQKRTILFTVEPIPWKGVPCLMTSSVDISERKQAEQQLHESEVLLRQVLESIPDSTFALDTNYRFLIDNQRHQEELIASGGHPFKVGDEMLSPAYPPEVLSFWQAAYDRALAGETFNLENSWLDTNGNLHFHENRFSPLHDATGTIIGALVVAHDISNRKRAEQESAYRQELLEKVIQLGKNIASLTDLDTCLHEIYNSTRFGLGYDRVGLFLYDATLQHVLGVYGTTRTGEVEEPGFYDGSVNEYSHSWGKALQSPSGIAWIENYQEQHNPPKGHIMFGVGQHITVAAWAGEKPVALISADNLLSGREIKPADMEALQLFAGYVGLAIENASLQTELELKVQERTVELRDLYDNSPAGYHSLDINGNFIQVNLTELKWLGRTYDEVIGHHVNEFITEQSRLTFQQNFPRFIQDGVLSNIEIEMVRKDGSTFLALVNATAIKDGQGNFLMSRSTLYDHTERKHTEEALQASEARFNFLLSQTPAVIFTAAITEHAPITFISNSVSNVLGYTPEDYERNPTRWLDNIHPDDKPSLMPAIQAVMETGNAIWEVRTKCADGQYRWISNGITLIKDENGNPQEIIGYSVNIDETKRAQEALRDNQENLQYFFDTASDLIQSMDENGNYLYVNAAWSQTLGYTSEEAKGLNMLQVVVPAYHEHCRSMLSSLVIDQHPQQLEVAFRTKQGHEVIVEGSVSSRKEPHGRIVTNGIFRNITERKRAEASMHRANIELERALRMKDEFLASMSHELRTPLTGILGLSEALQYDTYGELTPKQKSIVSNIESNGRHLLELINDILDISKMEAGKFDLNFAPCVLADICQASLQLVKGMAHKKNQNIAFSINPTDIIIQGDPRRLKQILVNLLSNAVKYSPEKSPIGLEVNANETEKIVKIEVWDKGMGISDDDIDRLFQPFVQLDSSLSRQQSGTGLGLALVKRLVDLHGGSIEVNSTPRQGSRFVVSLPYSSSPIELPEPKVEELPLDKNSLIVEDQTVDADRLNQFLKSLGIHSTVLTTGGDVLEKAAALQPGVILLDLNLPDGSGWEILKNLKRNEATRHIPVIVTSVQYEPEKARNFGADGSLVKLFTLNDLHQALIRLPRPEKIHPDQALVVSAEIHLGSIIVVDDNETNVLMVEDYLRSKNYHVYSYLNGDDFLANVEQVKPDLVLMDVQMPGMDGLEAIRRLRLLPQPEIASVPVIAITALAMPGDRERCLEAGANEYITKPVRLNKLVAMIQKILLKT